MKRVALSRGVRWLALVVGGASLLQAATCDTTTRALGEDLVTSVVDQWITSYFNDQLNVIGSGTNF